MEYFNELAAKYPLRPYSENEFGEQFILQKETQNFVITHFDEETGSDGIKIYLDIASVIMDYIESNDLLNQYVSLVKIQEAGEDYLVIPYHPGKLFSSLSKIERWDDEDKPDELVLMREAVTRVCENWNSPKEKIIAEILKADLLGPTFNTYFDEHIEKFIITEPGIKPEHLQLWATTMES